MAPPRRPKIAIGPDVGKSLHQAYVMTRDVETLTSKSVANRKMPSTRFSPNSSAPSAYLPSMATHKAPSCSATTNKTDERDESPTVCPQPPIVGPKTAVNWRFPLTLMFPGPRQVGVVLRICVTQLAIRDAGIVDGEIPKEKQTAEEPAHALAW